MLYDVYFHNDFDGRASAAVMLAFLRSRGDDIEHYVPLKYDIIPQWLDEKFFEKHELIRGGRNRDGSGRGKRNPAIVVDFPYHPGTTFWFDHHLSPFRKPIWEKKFKTDRFRRYDDGYRSACHLVYDSLKRDFGWKPPARLKELVKWLDIIDGANYRSAKQTIAMKEPAIRINNFIETNSNNLKTTIWTIQCLAGKSLPSFADTPRIKKDIRKLRRGTGAALNFYKKKLEIVGGVMTVDISGFRFGELAHYAPYYLHPKILYAIRFHPFPGRPSLFHLNVSANPWRREETKKHIGELLKRYGGGGHQSVGGVEFEGRKKMMRAIGEIVAFLNKK